MDAAEPERFLKLAKHPPTSQRKKSAVRFHTVLKWDTFQKSAAEHGRQLRKVAHENDPDATKRTEVFRRLATETLSPQHAAHLLPPLGDDCELRSTNRGNLIDQQKSDGPQRTNETIELVANQIFSSFLRIRVEDTVDGPRPRPEISRSDAREGDRQDSIKVLKHLAHFCNPCRRRVRFPSPRRSQDKKLQPRSADRVWRLFPIVSSLGPISYGSVSFELRGVQGLNRISQLGYGIGRTHLHDELLLLSH